MNSSQSALKDNFQALDERAIASLGQSALVHIAQSVQSEIASGQAAQVCHLMSSEEIDESELLN